MGRLIKTCIPKAVDILNHKETCELEEFEWACGYAIEALKEMQHYKDLEEQGRLIELPCKVGTEVFQVYADDCGNVPCLYGDCGTCKSAYWKIIETTFRTIHIEDFGKTVFLTKEEAEAKLRDLLEIENVKVFKEKFKELKELKGDKE